MPNGHSKFSSFGLLKFLSAPQVFNVTVLPRKTTGLCHLSTHIALGCGVSMLAIPLELTGSVASRLHRIDSFVLTGCVHLVIQ